MATKKKKSTANNKYIILLLFFQIKVCAQNNKFISGYIKDIATNENIINAYLKDNVNNNTSYTNEYGYFSFILTNNSKEIIVSHLGFKTKILNVEIYKTSEPIIIYLEEKTTDLNEVTVSFENGNSINNSIIGINQVTIDRLNKIPVILGEKDLIKSLSTTPGVSTTSEISSGLIVRGGSIDQNLILIDGATVYNTSHLFGLVSAFNTDAIKDVRLYKGVFPTKFGGRTSSVLDIILKEGNSKERAKILSVSPISSRFLIEGPISKRDSNSSYMLSVRASYLSLFLLPRLLKFRFSTQGEAFNYNLYDINSKINKKVSRNSSIYFSLYHGHDYWSNRTKNFDNKGKFGIDWGNTTLTTRYAINISNNLFLNTILTASRYQYNIGTKTLVKSNEKWITESFLNSNSNINDLSSKAILNYYPLRFITLTMGIENTNHYIKPTFVKSSIDIEQQKLQDINNSYLVKEMASFIEADIKYASFLHIVTGVRRVNFVTEDSIYHYLEPRLGINILIKKTALKIGYSKMNQGLHLVSSNSVGLPNDVWIPATNEISPANSSIKSLGVSNKINNNYEISIEGYLKEYSGLIDYKLNESFLSNFSKSWLETIETNGIGRAFGFELFINKIKGNLTGWLSYSYSNSQRKFQNINNNEWFNTNYNRKHNLSIVISKYNTKKNTTFSCLWNIQSGSAITLPIALIPSSSANELGGYWPQYVYGKRNNGLTPIYHRLDLSYEWQGRKKVNHRNPKITFGLINAYNQTNPLYIKHDFDIILNKNKGNITSVRSIYKKVGILPILPFLSYSTNL